MEKEYSKTMREFHAYDMVSNCVWVRHDIKASGRQWHVTHKLNPRLGSIERQIEIIRRRASEKLRRRLRRFSVPYDSVEKLNDLGGKAKFVELKIL